jgi:hypothetical protein
MVLSKDFMDILRHQSKSLMYVFLGHTIMIFVGVNMNVTNSSRLLSVPVTFISSSIRTVVNTIPT